MFTFKQVQLDAIAWLEKHGSGILRLRPGRGKSLVAMTYCLPLGKSLIVCPAKQVSQWRDEIGKFYPQYAGNVAVASGNQSERAAAYRLQKTVTIASYEAVRDDWKMIASLPLDNLILDESQRAKENSSKTYKAVAKLAAKAKRRVLLSATPAPNGLYEYWTQLNLIEPDCLGSSFYEFRARYCVMHPHIRGVILSYRNTDEIAKVIARHEFNDDAYPIDLPPKTEATLIVQMTSEEKALYEQLKKECRIMLEGEEKLTVPNVGALFIRLRQLTDAPWTVDCATTCTKYERLKELLSDGKKTMVFVAFRGVAERLKEELGDKVALFLGGSTKTAVAEMDRFKKDPACTVLVSTSAGEIGLNVQEAKRIVHYSLPFNPSQLAQRNARSWRTGQTDNTEVVTILAEKTVDQRLKALIERKEREGEKVKLSAREFAKLLDL